MMGHRAGRVRAVVEGITPAVDAGRFPVKRILGDLVTVHARAFADGHDVVSARLLHRHERDREWHTEPMSPLANDVFRGQFRVETLGRHVFTVCAWVDHVTTWQRAVARKHAAGRHLEVDFLHGAALGRRLAQHADAADAKTLIDWADAIVERSRTPAERYALSQNEALAEVARRCPDPGLLATAEPPLVVVVDAERARFSSWYELFPRSTSGEHGRHGTLADCAARLSYVADMGFDVLYLPPIHAIGRSERKGANNLPRGRDEDPGSPWAIGDDGLGHKSVHPALGTLEDFSRLVTRATDVGVAIALDLAFQCSPDHPYVREHPEWFLMRPDGTIQYAENPPKQYQDIYPFHFETDAWAALWDELKSIVEFWIDQGVHIFRVDNPHTKPFAFWEWLIADVKHRQPDVIFLSEAFARPNVMYRLAKLGFTQSYTYFTWRNTKHELTEYLRELTTPPVDDFLRASFWPNTPDILSEYLQMGGRPAFVIRLVLAATTSSSYGIYGPAFELMERTPREPGSEEYRDSEKYQLRHWDLERGDSLRDLITRINRIRQESPALQRNDELTFHSVANDALIAYSKSAPALREDGHEVVITVVNLDPHHHQSGWVELDLDVLGIEPNTPFQVHDLLSGARHLWNGARNFVALDPQHSPAHIFRVRRRVRTERDFDYFM